MNTKTDYKAAALAKFSRDVLTERLVRAEEDMIAQFQSALSECESPIEAQLLLAIFDHGEFDGIFVRSGAGKRFFGYPPEQLQICPQFEIGHFRCDFAIKQQHPHGTCTRIIVECDGHDFHERTKDQARRDKSRDRYLQANGWRVLRFTGSEIYRDAAACVAEIALMIENDSIDDWRSVNG